MGRTSFEDRECGIARALEVLGDWWTLLIVREAFFGTRRFADFQRNLGIARNILSQRLNQLVRDGILEPVDAGRYGTRFEYRLTGKGEDLLPVLTALREWGDRWSFGEGREPLVLRDRETQRRIPRLEVRDADGRPLGRRDIMAEPGPGASLETRSRFQRRRAPSAPTATPIPTGKNDSPADSAD
jgi:DNA-binding HxlR family transcriptional regulator